MRDAQPIARGPWLDAVLALQVLQNGDVPEVTPQLLRFRVPQMPRAPRIAPAELVELGERYARATGYPIQYQWTLLDGINDTDEELDGIARLLRGKYALLNMIPYNTVDGLDFKRPSRERAEAIARTLHARGVLTKLRQSAGQAVEGGCGQLRARERAPAAQVVTFHRRVEAVA